MNKTDRSASEASIAKFIGLISEGFIQVAQISPEKMAQAATLALDLGLPFKDCIYLTLAMELDCDLVTCDAKFAAKTKGVWDHVHVLGQFDPRR